MVAARSSFIGVGGGPNCYLKKIYTDSVQWVYEDSFSNGRFVFEYDLQYGEDEEMNFRVSKFGLILSLQI